MKKQKKQKSKFVKAIRKFFRKTILFVTLVTAAVAAILKLIDYFKSAKSEKDNPGRDFKDLWNLVGKKDFKLDDTSISGVRTKNIAGVTTIDLTEADFKSDGFISLFAFCSVVTIVVPNGTKVKVDGLINASSITNDAEAGEDDTNVLYIASKCTCSVVSIIEEME